MIIQFLIGGILSLDGTSVSVFLLHLFFLLLNDFKLTAPGRVVFSHLQEIHGVAGWGIPPSPGRTAASGGCAVVRYILCAAIQCTWGKKFHISRDVYISHLFPLHSSFMVTPDWIIRSILYKKEGNLRQAFQSSFCWQLFKWSFLGSSVSNSIILFELVTMNYDKLSWYARFESFSGFVYFRI